MNIAFFELEGWEEPIVRESLPGHEIFASQDKVTSLCLPNTKDFEVLSVFIDSRVDRAVLDCFPNVKLITTRSTGYDHIDIAAAKERGIAVAYVPGYGDNTVAEFAFGLILNLTRKMYRAIDQMKETGSFSLEGLRGVDLKDKILGVIGTGRIGREMIKIAKGFDMKVLAFDPMPDEGYAKTTGFEYADLDTLLKSADIVSLHCPYNKATHHLINRDNVSLFKKGAYLVNTARGSIVETQALIDGMENGILAGVGLDVLEEEGETKDELNLLREGHPKEEELKTMLQNHILVRMPNVLITPHNAFNSYEALRRILETTMGNIRGFIDGAPKNLVP